MERKPELWTAENRNALCDVKTTGSSGEKHRNKLKGSSSRASGRRKTQRLLKPTTNASCANNKLVWFHF